MSGITDPNELYFKDGTWGWDGTRWRPLPLLWGFGGVVEEGIVNSNLAAGTNYLYGTPVPAGEIWVVTVVSVAYAGTAPQTIAIIVQGLAGDIILLRVSPVTAGQWYVFSGNVILQEGDRMMLYITGATAGDDAYLRYAGYKMKIA